VDEIYLISTFPGELLLLEAAACFWPTAAERRPRYDRRPELAPQDL